MPHINKRVNASLIVILASTIEVTREKLWFASNQIMFMERRKQCNEHAEQYIKKYRFSSIVKYLMVGMLVFENSVRSCFFVRKISPGMPKMKQEKTHKWKNHIEYWLKQTQVVLTLFDVYKWWELETPRNKYFFVSISDKHMFSKRF